MHTENSAVGNVRLCDTASLRAKFGGKSDMWIWRRLKDGTLPPPIMISGRRYWREDEIGSLIDKLSNARVASGAEAA